MVKEIKQAILFTIVTMVPSGRIPRGPLGDRPRGVSRTG